MEVTETAAAGLKREFRVVVPATDLEAKVNARLDDIKGRVQLRGFRPGKVPVAHLKRLYGKSAMAEVIEAAVREANSQIVTERGLKLATEPKVVLPPEEGAVEGIIAGKADLAYTVEMEIVPPIALADFKAIKLERLTAPLEDSEIDQALQTIAEQSRPFNDSADAPAAQGDRVTISFQGSIDGEPFEGGSGDDVALVLGSAQFIPGFEDQLVGVKAGDSRTVEVKFPETYRVESLAGKNAVFSVTAKKVERRARSASTMTLPKRSDWNRSPSFATRFASVLSASTRRPHARRSSAPCSTSSTRGTNSIRRPRYWKRSSKTSGRRSRTTSSSKAEPSPMKGPPRKKRGRNIAPLPSAGCGSVSSWPRSERKTTSKSRMNN
jgi:hypothetical protein